MLGGLRVTVICAQLSVSPSRRIWLDLTLGSIGKYYDAQNPFPGPYHSDIVSLKDRKEEEINISVTLRHET